MSITACTRTPRQARQGPHSPAADSGCRWCWSRWTRSRAGGKPRGGRARARYAALAGCPRPAKCCSPRTRRRPARDRAAAVVAGRGAALGRRHACSRIVCAAGWHARPLLGFSRADLNAWAREAGLTWLEDPSNLDPRFDRNYLRLEVLPALRRRWPAAARTVGRVAAQAAEALEVEAAIAGSGSWRRSRTAVQSRWNGCIRCRSRAGAGCCARGCGGLGCLCRPQERWRRTVARHAPCRRRPGPLRGLRRGRASIVTGAGSSARPMIPPLLTCRPAPPGARARSSISGRSAGSWN